MPYIPDLIPPEHQVLPEYFNTRNPINRQSQKPQSSLWWVAVVVLATVAILYIGRPIIAALLLVTAILCAPYGKNQLETKAKFRLTPKLRLIFCLILLLPCVPLIPYYQNAEIIAAKQLETQRRQAELFTADSLKRENLRENSLHNLIGESKKQTPTNAWATLAQAARYSKTPGDKDTLTLARHTAALVLVSQLIRRGRYQNAQAILAQQMQTEPANPELLYNRALCYYKAGDIKHAISDLDSARSGGYQGAAKLYKQLLRKYPDQYDSL